jgi:AcrR family transcriptional regulator
VFNEEMTSGQLTSGSPGRGGSGRVGRPSKVHERRVEIVDAFIRLVARNGLESVTLDDVAAEAGVRRAAARHFVGNRAELIVAAIEELTCRYQRSVREVIGTSPSIDRLVDALFGRLWVSDLNDIGNAFDVLLQEALRHEPTRLVVKQAYEVLLSEIAASLERSRPAMSQLERRDVAYAIACLAEHNVVMQQLGFPLTRSTAARACANSLIPPP